ncbi:MAG TPA: hypothetical protein VG186_11840 [Solirubrobacteraceae bacterium]|nr:hypothetical protein [Solirubrobacteraceae bacterium]
MAGTYASAIAITVVSVLLGRGICLLAGRTVSPWLSPAVGFAALMVLCDAAIGLPGRAGTAVAVVVVACAVAVGIIVWRRTPWPAFSDGPVVAIVVLIVVSIPFLASDRVGLLGIGFLNDTHWHLIMAEGLRNPAIQAVAYGVGYPLGPHAVAAVFAQALGTDVASTLTGVLMATPALIGLAALGALQDIARSRRLPVAVLAAVPYLGMAWYIQSAFKEPILSLLLLGFVVVVQQARRERFANPLAALVPTAVLTAGIIYDYSYPGLLWPAAIVVCWAALELTVGGGWRHLRAIVRGLRAWLPGIGAGAVVLVVLIAPDIGRLHAFWTANSGTGAATSGGVVDSSLANLVAPLRLLEGLNVWLSGDFRIAPTDQLNAGALAGFAVVVLAFALVSALARRDLAWLGAMLAFVLIYYYVKRTSTPYVSAKTLVIPASLLVLGSAGELMRALERGRWGSVATLGVAGAAILFLVFSLQSSYLVLANAAVGPDDHLNELRALRPLLHDRPTLTLYYDDYVQWELLGDPLVSSPLLTSVIPAPIQPAKRWSYGQPLFFTSVTPATLNRFDYVITARTTANGTPPPNFHLVGSSRSYEVWKRVGDTPPFRVLPSPGQPGAILDCHTAAGRRIAREPGYATVSPQPLSFPLTPVAAGGSEQVVLHLAPGEWDISLPFTSTQAITVRGAGLDTWLPPNLDRIGTLWPVGRIRSTGSPVTLTVDMANPTLLDSTAQFFVPGSMLAVPASPSREVPLRDACGQYVDWYVVT